MTRGKRKPTRYEEKYQKLSNAFASLLGANGEEFVNEIMVTGKLSYNSYQKICELTLYGSYETLAEHFGIVQSYYYNTVIEERVRKQKQQTETLWITSL
jgi:hypothetical protein